MKSLLPALNFSGPCIQFNRSQRNYQSSEGLAIFCPQLQPTKRGFVLIKLSLSLTWNNRFAGQRKNRWFETPDQTYCWCSPEHSSWGGRDASVFERIAQFLSGWWIYRTFNRACLVLSCPFNSIFAVSQAREILGKNLLSRSSEQIELWFVASNPGSGKIFFRRQHYLKRNWFHL